MLKDIKASTRMDSATKKPRPVTAKKGNQVQDENKESNLNKIDEDDYEEDFDKEEKKEEKATTVLDKADVIQKKEKKKVASKSIDNKRE